MTAFGSQPSSSTFAFGSSQPSGSSKAPFSFATSSTTNGSAFGAFPTSGADGDMMDSDEDDEDVVDEDTLYLEPPAFSRKDKAKWKASGRCLTAAASPLGGEVAVWVTKQPSSDPNQPSNLNDTKLSEADRLVDFATINTFAPAVTTMFSETYPIFASLQQILAIESAQISLVAGPGTETISHMRRIVDLYLQEAHKLRQADDLDDDTRLTYDSVYHILNLAAILYLPSDGMGQQLVGEELLDWVNEVDTVHINTIGNEIMQTKEPYDNQSFWPIIIRCILRGFFKPASSFLQTLSSHPHPPIAKFGQMLSSQLSAFPRSTHTELYPLDHQFLSAHKTWLARFRAEVVSFTGGRSKGHWFDAKDGSGRGEWAELEDGFRSVVELMEGKEARLLEEVSDWREALGAWGILVEPGLRRDYIPGVVKHITDSVPLDSTIPDNSIQHSLCVSDIARGLLQCHQLNSWLAAHLGDIFDKLFLIEDDEERFDIPLRDFLLLEYADMIMESPSQSDLWQVIAQYLAVAGEEGQRRLREYIVRVDVRLGSDDGGEKANGMEVENDDEHEERLRQFSDLQSTCREHGLQEEWSAICTTLAGRLLRKGDYSTAAAVCVSAKDGYTLSRIAEKILLTYTEQGPAEFLRLVHSLPPQVLRDIPEGIAERLDDTDGTMMPLYVSRIAFLSDFRDYLLFLREGDRARAASSLVELLMAPNMPVEFWAVMLSDSVDLLEDDEILIGPQGTFELMRVLEDVLANARFAPSDYLRQLWRYLERQAPAEATKDKGTANGSSESNKDKDEVSEGTEKALRELEVVRLALARNLSRALVAGVEGF